MLKISRQINLNFVKRALFHLRKRISIAQFADSEIKKRKNTSSSERIGEVNEPIADSNFPGTQPYSIR